MTSPQRTANDTLAFISRNLASRHAVESMTKDTLESRPTDAELRCLCQDTILTMKEFTSGHQVVSCAVPGAVRALALAFDKLQQADTTRLSVIMNGGIKIGREWDEDAFQENGRMRFFKDGIHEEVPGTLLWEVEVISVPDGSGGCRKELKHDTTHVWVPFKPGAGEEGSHLGDFYAALFQEYLSVANKVPGKTSAKYFERTPSTNELTVWDTTGNHVSSFAMAMMHLLAVRIARVNTSDDEKTSLRKMLQDEIVARYWIAECRAEDKSDQKSTFFSMGLLFWAITHPTELEAKIKG
ncbi:hypothetical protein CGCSCA5_v015065 [Colletotrichum siamense]|nr:hypothetical protein CGCSCA5_v015065 [Colletotrichum siamense]